MLESAGYKLELGTDKLSMWMKRCKLMMGNFFLSFHLVVRV